MKIDYRYKPKIKVDFYLLVKVPQIGMSLFSTGPCIVVGNMSDYRYMSDCISRGREFAPGLAASHTFMEIDHEIISTAILFPSTDSRRAVVSYKRKYVHEVLVNPLVKLAQEKSAVR